MTRPALKNNRNKASSQNDKPLEGEIFLKDGTFVPTKDGKFPGGRGSFKKGMRKIPGSGRKKGQQNHNSKILKDAILNAAARVGRDGKGTDQLEGYCIALALSFPKTFAHLLARVLPYQVNATVDVEYQTFRTREEIEAEMRKRGLPIPVNMFN